MPKTEKLFDKNIKICESFQKVSYEIIVFR
jgi:hypothetical protein